MNITFVAFQPPQLNVPAIIFINEIDAIAGERMRGEVETEVFSELLTLMDGNRARSNVVIIAATEDANSIDPDLRRFSKEI